jgi:hypothetical protein
MISRKKWRLFSYGILKNFSQLLRNKGGLHEYCNTMFNYTVNYIMLQRDNIQREVLFPLQSEICNIPTSAEA